MKAQEVSVGSNLYEAALQLRYELFFRDIGLPKSVVPDDLEDASTHLALADNGALIGYSRLSRLSKNDYRISQVVVSPSHQGKGHSTTLMNYLINKASLAGAVTIRLNSQLPVVGLYEKLGFVTVGEVYTVELTGLPHRKMVLHVDT